MAMSPELGPPEDERLHTLLLPAPTRLDLEEIVTTVATRAPCAGSRGTVTLETVARIQPERRWRLAVDALPARQLGVAGASAGPSTAAPGGTETQRGVARCRSRPDCLR